MKTEDLRRYEAMYSAMRMWMGIDGVDFLPARVLRERAASTGVAESNSSAAYRAAGTASRTHGNPASPSSG